MKWDELIGKKIAAFRGIKSKNTVLRKTEVKLDFILFDDKESYIELREQDRYDYHDCNNSARVISLYKNAQIWQMMFDKENNFDEPELGHDPFY